MTPRQKDVLSYIRDYRAKYGISPTIGEIGEHLKLSKTAVHEHLTNLEKDGHLRKKGDNRQPRAFEPVGDEVVLRSDALGVVDAAFRNKKPDDKVGTLHKTITDGIKKLPSQE